MGAGSRTKKQDSAENVEEIAKVREFSRDTLKSGANALVFSMNFEKSKEALSNALNQKRNIEFDARSKGSNPGCGPRPQNR